MWGTIARLFFQAAKFAGPASIGYFVNDASRFFAGLLPISYQDKVKDPSQPSGFKPWFLVLVLVIMGAGLYLVLKMLAGKKKSIFVLVAGLIGAALFGAYEAGGVYILGTALVTLTTGAAVVTTATTTFVPRIFFYAAATQLTGVKITVQGDGVVFDSDANGLTHCGLNRTYGQVTNTYVFRIANGLIQNKNVLWEFTNSAAQTPVVYYDSDITPPAGAKMYLQLLRQTVLVGGTDFDDFATLSLPSMAANDYANILYEDGTQQANMNRLDLQAYLQFTQNIVNTPIYQVDNYAKRVKKVNVQVAAQQTAYVQRWVQPISDGMISQSIIATNG